MARPNHYSDEALLTEIRIFYRRHKRVPKSSEYAPSFPKAIQRRFGSWEKGVRLAIDTDAVRHYWTDEEILKLIRSLKNEHGRFPTMKQLRQIKESLSTLIRTRFGGIDEVMERAFGDSPRSQALSALLKLTPPGCDRATSSEVHEEIRKGGVVMDTANVVQALSRLRERGHVTGGKVGDLSWWSPTAAGRRLMRDLEKSRANLDKSTKENQ